MRQLYLQHPFPCYTDPLSSGIIVFFVVEFAVMTGQAFLVCEVVHTEWKEIPGSICLLPRFVPISLVISKSPSPPFPRTCTRLLTRWVSQ